MDRSRVRRRLVSHITRGAESAPSAQSLREFHARGGTREEIEGALRIMPFVSHPARQLAY